MLAVKLDMRPLETLAVNAPKQVNFATMVALNQAAYQGAEATKAEMRQVFDSPTPWVLGGVRYVKATRDKLYAQVDFDFWGNKQSVTVEKILKAEIEGGDRSIKRFESALRRVGVLPSGMFAVPGAAAKLDAYGNMQAGQIVQIIAWFQAFGEQGYKANMTDRTKARLGKDSKRKGTRGFAYVAIQRGNRSHLRPGIYQKIITGFGSALRPVLIFVDRAHYQQRLDFYTVADTAARKAFQQAFPDALAKALRTARPGPS